MKRILISLLFLCLTIDVLAQVSYGSTTWGTYNMKINVVTEDDLIFLHLIFTSEKQKISGDPKLLLRLMDESIISLGYIS